MIILNDYWNRHGFSNDGSYSRPRLPGVFIRSESFNTQVAERRWKPVQPLCIPVLSRLHYYKFLQVFSCMLTSPGAQIFPFFLSCLVLGSICLYSTAVVFPSRFFRSELLANQFFFSSAKTCLVSKFCFYLALLATKRGSYIIVLQISMFIRLNLKRCHS